MKNYGDVSLNKKTGRFLYARREVPQSLASSDGFSRRDFIHVCMIGFFATFGLASCASNGARSSRSSVSNRSRPQQTQVNVNNEIVNAIRRANDATYRTASEKLDQWAVEQAILADQQFIPWFTSYWTEQVLTAKQLMYRLDEAFGGRPAEERLTEDIQREYYERVLGGEQGDKWLERLGKSLLKEFLIGLENELDRIYQRRLFSGDRVAWERKMSSIPAYMTVGSTLSLPQAIQASRGSATNSASSATIRRKIQRRVGSRASMGLVTGSGTALSKTIAKKAASKVLAKATSRFLGALITIGIMGFEVYQHYDDVEQRKQALRLQIREALNALKSDLLDDKEDGVMASVQEVMSNAIRHLI